MKRIKKRRAFELCWNERRALAVVDSPFAVGLKYAFHDAESSRLVLVIDLMMGGDLKYWLSQHKCFGFEAIDAANVIRVESVARPGLCLQGHAAENMLVDEHGSGTGCRILGLACRVHSELKGASGTPGYMAPEMLRREVYDHRVDYFSLGCMVVEFVVGVCPFRTRDAAHWGGRKKKKKKKKQDTEDRALRKQAKKEDRRNQNFRIAQKQGTLHAIEGVDPTQDFHTGQHGARRARDGAGLDPGRLEGGSRSRGEGVLQGPVAQGPVEATRF